MAYLKQSLPSASMFRTHFFAANSGGREKTDDPPCNGMHLAIQSYQLQFINLGRGPFAMYAFRFTKKTQ